MVARLKKRAPSETRCEPSRHGRRRRNAHSSRDGLAPYLGRGPHVMWCVAVSVEGEKRRSARAAPRLTAGVVRRSAETSAARRGHRAEAEGSARQLESTEGAKRRSSPQRTSAGRERSRWQALCQARKPKATRLLPSARHSSRLVRPALPLLRHRLSRLPAPKTGGAR